VIGAGPVPGTGPLIVVANHTSILDGILIHAVTRRPLRIFVAAEWVTWWPLRPLFRIMGAIPVDRERRNPAALDRAIDALERGDVVAIFPEGGIQVSGRLGVFRNGASRLAFRTGAPVLPCAIIGSFEALPWPRRLPRPLRITVRRGEALRVDRLASDVTVSDWTARDATVTDWTARDGAAPDVTASDGATPESRGTGSPARGRRSGAAARSSAEALTAATEHIREAVRALLEEEHGEVQGAGGVPSPSSPGGPS
jgi:1-acyl-sn-glycerol-3-phosphate acyltransferase